MPRYALKLEYDGTGFVGWQRQPASLSIQGVLETAAEKLAGVPVSATVAGRTDAGVHAAAQVAHLDLPRALEPVRVAEALGFYMRPHAIVVVQAAEVDDAFSARFTAIGRRYRYVVLDRRARPALDRNRVWHVPDGLDAAAMHAAAQTLLGRHDFTSFRASSCQAKSPVRTLDRLDVFRDGDRVVIEADARSFLHHQVRNLVGTLRLVGGGARPVGWPAEALAARDRAASGPTAPPQGLTLTSVVYPVDPFGPLSFSPPPLP